MFSRQITCFFLVAAAVFSASGQQSNTDTGAITVPPIIPATPITPPPAPTTSPPGTIPAVPPATDPASPPVQNPQSDLEIAKLPYKELIKIAQSDSKQSETTEDYTLKISSRLGVPANQIKLYLEKKDGPFPLTIDQNGFFQVPFSWQLMEQNPLLISNQPKGSLNLQVDLALPAIEPPKVVGGKVSYRDLFAPILELNDSMRRVDPEFGRPDQQQFAVEIKPGTEGTVKIQRQYGARTLKTDKNGSVWLVFEKLLQDEKAEVLMPEGAEVSVLPVSAEQAMAIRSQ